jgi:WD40 repeat protein
VCTHTFVGHKTALNHVDLSINGILASADAYGDVKLWDLRNVSEIRTIEYNNYSDTGKSAAVTRIAFDPSGKNLIFGSSDGYIRILDVNNFKNRIVGFHCESGVQSVIFDKNASFIVSSGTDGTVKYWA